MPPATTTASPVIEMDRGDAKNVTTHATSSAVITFRTSVRCAICASSSATDTPMLSARAAIPPMTASVCVAPGWTTATLMQLWSQPQTESVV